MHEMNKHESSLARIDWYFISYQVKNVKIAVNLTRNPAKIAKSMPDICVRNAIISMVILVELNDLPDVWSMLWPNEDEEAHSNQL